MNGDINDKLEFSFLGGGGSATGRFAIVIFALLIALVVIAVR
jgi:hypothetical protein